jgi:hypothetical protein
MPWFAADDEQEKENVAERNNLVAHSPTLQKPSLWEGDRAGTEAGARSDAARLDAIGCAMAQPELLRRCGWRHVALLRAVSASVRTWVDSGEDAWKTLAQCLADEAGLYMPPACADWKRYFFEHLFPARHKWNVESERISDHRIRVAVRFKPGVQRDRQLVLPLHQRLKMLKKGEKISAEEAAGEKGLSVDEVKAQLVHMAGGDLDADVLEMLQDAANLQHAASRAETDAINQERRILDKWDSDAGPGGTGTPAETEQDPTNAAWAGGHGGSAGGSGGPPEAAATGAEDVQDEGVAQRRRSGRSRVLSVERSKVVAFVPGVGVRPFNFAHIFDKEASQEDLYSAFAQNAVLCALNGFNACVLAYGQTGSGKTFSLFGPPGWLASLQAGADLASSGIVVRSARDLLGAAQRMGEAGGARISVSAQYVQVYKEVVTCLGTGEKVTLRGGGSHGSFTPIGAADVPIDSPEQLLDLLERGEEYKRYGATAMNDRSSRAHTVLLLNLTHVRPSPADDAGAACAGGEIVKSQLLLADLAGCEHINKSNQLRAACPQKVHRCAQPGEESRALPGIQAHDAAQGSTRGLQPHLRPSHRVSRRSARRRDDRSHALRRAVLRRHEPYADAGVVAAGSPRRH